MKKLSLIIALLGVSSLCWAASARQDAAEEHHVTQERADLERRAERQPPDVAVLDLVPGLAQPEQLRQHEIEQHDRREHEQGNGEQPSTREANAQQLGWGLPRGTGPRIHWF